jgi:hypothetical protein
MAVTYKNSGAMLNAAEWNTVFAAQDTLLTNVLSGLSPLLIIGSNIGVSFVGSPCWPKMFFFFNPVAPTLNTLHPMAAACLGQMRDLCVQKGFWRQYNHSAITTLIAGLSPDSGTPTATSSTFGVVRLTSPTLAAWYAAIYPESGYGTVTAFPLDLDACLSVLTQTISGTTYNVCLGPTLATGLGLPSDFTNGFINVNGTIERVHVWDEVELIITGNLSFPDTYNKYNNFRIHNFGRSSAVVTFGAGTGGGVITIPSGECRCIRRTGPGGTYTAGFNYCQMMLPEDPRFFALAAQSAYATLDGGFVTHTVAGDINNPIGSNALVAQQVGRNFDLTKFWDMSSLYASLFPAPALSMLVGDALVTLGKFLAVRWGAYLGHTGGYLLSGLSFSVASAVVSVRGTGYSLLDVLTVVGGTGDAATLSVTGIFAGGAYTVAVLDPGNYSVFPTSPASTTGGGGTGATYTLTSVSGSAVAAAETVPISFTGFAAIATALGLANTSYLTENTAGITWSLNTSTGVATLTAQMPTGSYWFVDLIDLTTNLISFLTGNWRWTKLGTPSPPNGGLASTTLSGFLKTFSRWARIVTQSNTTVVTYYSYTSGPYTIGAAVNQNLVNQTCVADSTDTTLSLNYYITQQVQVLATFIALLDCTLINVTNIQIKLTPFGFAFCWQETYSIVTGFNLSLIDRSTNFIGMTRNLATLNIQRGFILNAVFGNSAFPPLFSLNSSASSASNQTPWHFPRAGRPFASLRNITHDGTKEPWQTTNASYQSNEPPNVKRFFETMPATTESAEPTTEGITTELVTRMGAQDSIPGGAWLQDSSGILFSLWYAGTLGGTINYEQYLRAVGDGARAPATGERATVNGAATQLPDFVEHYNMAASQANGIPTLPKKNSMGNVGATAYTLTLSSIFIVSGGAGYVVGNVIYPWIPGVQFICKLTVASVDGSGKLLTVTLSGATVTDSGAPMSNVFNALVTPSRPFGHASDSGVSPTINATFDFAAGDGTALNFLPAYAPSGVPLPSGMTGTFWPRTAHWSWNGPSPGGADPVGDYITGLGATAQTTLPDSYGAALPIYEYLMDDLGNITSSTVSSYAQNFTPAFQAIAATYRWLTIADARNLFSAFSVPFVLNSVATPQQFIVENVAAAVTPTTSSSSGTDLTGNADNDPTFNPNINGRLPTYSDPIVAHGPLSGPGPFGYSNVLAVPIFGDPPVDSGGGFLGYVNQIVSGFANVSSGNWFTSYAATNLSASASPIALVYQIDSAWTATDSEGVNRTHYTAINPYLFINLVGGVYTWQRSDPYTVYSTSYVLTYAQPSNVGTPQPAQKINLTAICVLAENSSPQIIVASPQNYFYYSLTFEAANAAAVAALGTSIIPIIVDNTVELNTPEFTHIPGVGGIGAYETVITTALANATVTIVPVDN